MALTTTQVNQAFLATLGRPAEGSAATWGSTSLSLDALLDSIFIAENTDGDFVEYLYQNILGRASDAEGKAFWNSLLATTSKEAVLAQFKAAVLAAGQADPANADYQSFIAQNKAFVTELYTNLLGRTDAASADAEGVEFWANALASGTSKGALLAQFTAAALSDPNSDDAQTLNAKVNVANAITAKFNNFNADVTADQKKAALDALKATMTEVVAGSTAEDFQERIDTFAGNYQNRVAQVFTTKDDDQLDASEATASTVFSGNVNLIDPAKGTIQTTDSVAGNSNYTDTLRVSVTSDSANKDFSLTSNLPTSVSSIEKLIITAGAANVNGTLDGTNYADATITSTGDVDLKISGDQTELKVTAGDKKEAAITVESGSLDNYTGSAAKDTINVKAGSVKTIDTGAGKDVVTIASGANIKNEGSIKLGAGDDELTIEAALAKADTLNKISLDGGEGSKDKLTISTDITAVNSITGFETITTTGTSAKISADAANSLTSGTKLADKSDLKIDMSDKNSLNLKNLKVGNGTDNKLGTASVAIDGVAKGEITLTSTANNAIVETITLDKTTNDGKTGTVTIKGIGAAKLDASNTAKDVNSSGDNLKIDDITLTGIEQIKNYGKLPTTLTADTVYYINTAISSADDLSSKGTVLSFVGDNTALASGSKTLVALNNSAQNKSYIFEISGTDAKVTRDDITLKAIVDNAINSKDVISGGVIEFVAGTEAKDVKPAGGDTSGVVTYDSGATTLTPDATGTTYNNNTVKYSENKLYVQGVDNALTVSGAGAAAAGKTVNVYVSGDTINASTAITKSTAAGATVDVYLGGSKNTQTGNVDLKGIENNTLVSGVDKVYAYTKDIITLKTAAVLGASTKLDLGKVDAKIAFDTAATDSITLTNVVDNANSGDSITLKLAATASGKSFVGTAGKDTFDIQTTQNQKVSIALGNNDKAADVVKYAHAALTGFKADTITNFGTEDKIDIKALSLGTLSAKTASGTTQTFENGGVYQATISGKNADNIAFADVFAASSTLFGTTVAKNAAGVVVAKGQDDKYAILAVKNNDNTTLVSSEVGIIAVVDNEVAATNFITIA
ncbi:DUF4214 domain-containing protein [Campylobacter sp. 50012-21]|uniref:beta strand repeat-containing protein n=1 Tax=Campylobacter magnus TaxID=3026462 RepID=UPI002362F85A|nr:DUF4214 domain-containing protein [Campylobacter magnus]MDD0845911.1 DUF4214 domain-containing protein [Campylobacter magnus]